MSYQNITKLLLNFDQQKLNKSLVYLNKIFKKFINYKHDKKKH